MRTLDINPYRAQQIFSTIDQNQISDPQEKIKYNQTAKDLLSFKFPMHKLGLTTNSLSAMALDQDDLWIADSLGTISRYTLSTGEHTLIRKPQQSKMTQDIEYIFVQEDRIWITGKNYILTYNKRNGELFSSILPKGGRPISLVRYEDHLLLGIENFGIFSWNGESFEPSKFNTPELTYIQALVLHNDTLWAATNHGLYTLENQQWLQNLNMKDEHISHLSCSPQGLWGISKSSGLFLVDQDENLAIINKDIDISEIYILPDSVLVLNAKRERLQKVRITGKHSPADSDTVSVSFSSLSGLAFSAPYLILGSSEDAAFFIHHSLL